MPAEVPFGRYALLKKIASGGMAELFLARQRGLEGFEKFLAIKRILPERSDDPLFVRLFLNEARLAARLSHPNIVQIYDLGKEDDSYFLAMEFVSGEQLTTLEAEARSKGQRVPIPLVVKIGVDVCQGLYYAHHLTDAIGQTLRVVHCDISPQNVLVGYDGSVKIVDFGIAHVAAAPTAQVRGKAAYMSPEQARGEPLSHSTDIFSLGIVLYELLTGRLLFTRPDAEATLRAVREAPIPPPHLFVPDVPPALEAAILKALERDPAKRHATARDLQAALEAALGERVPSSTVLGEYMTALFKETLKNRVFVENRNTAVIPITTKTIDAPTVLDGMAQEQPEAAARSPKRMLVAAGVTIFAAISIMTWVLRAPKPVEKTPEAAPPPAQPTAAPAPAAPVAPPAPSTAPTIVKHAIMHARKGGTLSINTEPWTNVVIDGHAFGSTPVQQIKLSAGVHKLYLENPKLGIKRSISLEVAEGDQSQHRFLLERVGNHWVVARHFRR